MEVKSGKIENILSVMSHFQQENEKEMEIDLQLLNEKMSDLEQAIVHLKQNSKVLPLPRILLLFKNYNEFKLIVNVD